MALEHFLDAVTASERRLLVVNRSAANPIQRMLEDAFADQRVDGSFERAVDVSADINKKTTTAGRTGSG